MQPAREGSPRRKIDVWGTRLVDADAGFLGFFHDAAVEEVDGALGEIGVALGERGQGERGQTGSYPFSESSTHYEPDKSCRTNIRKRSVCPRVWSSPSLVPEFDAADWGLTSPMATFSAHTASPPPP